MSTGGSAWVDVVAGGGSFAEGGYNGVDLYGVRKPDRRPVRMDRPGQGATSAMTKVTVNLGAFAGQRRQGPLPAGQRIPSPCPGSLPGAGWWIDDVSFSKLNEPSNCANNAPIAVDDEATTTMNTPVTINVLGNDADPDGDEIEVTAVGSAAHGTAVENADGTITYTPAAVTQAPTASTT